MRRFILIAIASLIVAAFAAAPAGAARNPSGTGQPNASCEDPGSSAPNGFSSGGFPNAQSRYADHPNGNTNAVSQYDVACYQQTKNGH